MKQRLRMVYCPEMSHEMTIIETNSAKTNFDHLRDNVRAEPGEHDNHADLLESRAARNGFGVWVRSFERVQGGRYAATSPWEYFKFPAPQSRSSKTKWQPELIYSANVIKPFTMMPLEDKKEAA